MIEFSMTGKLQIRLISKDKQTLTIGLDALVKSSTLSTLISTLPAGHSNIPLTFANSSVLHLAVQWMNYHKYDLPSHDYDHCIGITDIEMCEYDAKLMQNLDCKMAFDLYDVCDFLDLHELHHLCSKALVKIFLARFPQVRVESVLEYLKQAAIPLRKNRAVLLPAERTEVQPGVFVLPFKDY